MADAPKQTLLYALISRGKTVLVEYTDQVNYLAVLAPTLIGWGNRAAPAPQKIIIYFFKNVVWRISQKMAIVVGP